MKKKKCITCGKVMINKGRNRVSKERWSKRIYCSNECKKVESRVDYSKNKKCPTCNNIFYRKENERGYTWLNKIYCSAKCSNSREERKMVLYEKKCLSCGDSFKTRFNKVNCCSKKCGGVQHAKNISGAGHHGWSGGRVTTKQGYIRVWIDDDSPFVSMRPKGSSHVLEHRLKMAQKIGRCLKKSETVHHKNGIRDDNRDDNLELRTGSHGVGATVHCPTCTCGKEKVVTEYLPNYTLS